MNSEFLHAHRGLIVCSDTHLGRGVAKTGFGGKAEDFASFLAQLAERADVVVINGDLYDLDRGTIPCAQSREYRAIQPRWSSVERTMERCGIRITAGNHDRALLDRVVAGAVVRESFEVSVGGKKVHIEHGERFDAPVKRVRSFTSFVTWLSGKVQEGPFERIYAWLRWAEKVSTNDESGALEQRIMSWFFEGSKADILVFGHTHKRFRGCVDGRWVINPGDTMTSRFHFVEIPADASEIRFGVGDGISPLCIESKIDT